MQNFTNEDYFYPLRNNQSYEANVNISEKFFYLKNWVNSNKIIDKDEQADFLRNQADLFLQSLIGKSYEELSHILELPSYIEAMTDITHVIPFRFEKQLVKQLYKADQMGVVADLPAYMLVHGNNTITPIEVLQNAANVTSKMKFRLHPKITELLQNDILLERYFYSHTRNSPEQYNSQYGYALLPDNARNQANIRYYHSGLIPRENGVYPPGAWNYFYHKKKSVLLKEGRHAFLLPVSRILPSHYAHVGSMQRTFRIPNLDDCKLFIANMRIAKRTLERGQGDYASTVEGTVHIPVETPYHLDEILQIAAATLKTVEPSAEVANHIPRILRDRDARTLESLLFHLFDEVYDPNFDIDQEVDD